MLLERQSSYQRNDIQLYNFILIDSHSAAAGNVIIKLERNFFD